MQMLVKISLLSFHTRVTPLETASPLSDSCSDVCGPAPPTPKLADVSTRQYSLCVSATPSLAWYYRKNSQQDLSPVSSDTISQVVWNPVTVRTALNSLNDVVCYFTSGKGLTPVWWACNKLRHPAISPEQGASKIVKISQQMAKLCQKLKWLVFFWDTV